MLGMKKRSWKTILAVWLVIAVGASMFTAQSPVSAEADSASTSSSVQSGGAGADLNDVASLTAFVDGIMNVQLNNYKIPGAVISIVKDGKDLFAKGYGRSNYETDALVDPKTSLFRIASTTKLFTWTAVMQLVEQGKISLDTDINTYLKTVKIPDTYPEPITMRHLMTHTAGFEDGGVGYQITTDPAKLPVSISETLNKHMPARVMPAGEMVAYSNYGTALAGLIVEEVSGLAYNDYIQKNIFDPLGMKYATAHEPVPDALKPYEVIGYARENGRYVTKPPTFEGGFRPAGSAAVSALDMSRFMIAHLQNGRYGDQQILQPETAKLMHAPAFKFDERMPAMDLGFYELKMNGLRIISHGGSDPLFNTELYLVPDKQVGIFVSYSGGNGGVAANALAKAFFDRYFPAEDLKLSPIAVVESKESVEKYTGAYQFARRNHSHIDKFFSFMAQISVGMTEDNLLTVGGGLEQQIFAPVGPNLFQEVGGTQQIGFRTDESGNVTHLFLDFIMSEPLERTPTINQTSFWFTLLGVSAFLFITSLLGYLIRRRDIKVMPKPQKWAMRLSAMTAGWALATCLATFVIVLNMDMVDRLSTITPALNMYLFMPIILVVLALAMLAVSVIAWMKSYWSVMGRVHFTLIAVAAVVLCWFFYHWNLLGWHFG